MTPTLEDAISLALTYHRGQSDKAGLPFILHPLRVMDRFFALTDDDARMVAILHDIVEDTDISLTTLRVLGYSDVVIKTIDAITRRKKEPYEDYIKRVGEDPLAARVKLSDLLDNTNVLRPSTHLLPSEQTKRYHNAQKYLMERLGIPVTYQAPVKRGGL